MSARPRRVPPPPPPGFGDDEYYRLYGKPEEYHRYRSASRDIDVDRLVFILLSGRTWRAGLNRRITISTTALATLTTLPVEVEVEGSERGREGSPRLLLLGLTTPRR